MMIIKFAGFKRNVFFATAAFFIFSLVSCSKKLAFQGSSVVPAAHGDVKVSRDNNKNYSIEVNVTNLAEPKNLQPPRNIYIVWMESKQNPAKKLGQLNSSSGFFSSALKASLKTVSATKPTSVFITAEDDVNIQYPGSQVVLRTNTW